MHFPSLNSESLKLLCRCCACTCMLYYNDTHNDNSSKMIPIPKGNLFCHLRKSGLVSSLITSLIRSHHPNPELKSSYIHAYHIDTVHFLQILGCLTVLGMSHPVRAAITLGQRIVLPLCQVAKVHVFIKTNILMSHLYTGTLFQQSRYKGAKFVF